MFFNKLREEFKEMLAKFAFNYSKHVLNAIKIYNLPIEEIKEIYKHTRWSKISPLEREALMEKYNIAYVLSYSTKKRFFYCDSDYISDTLEKIQNIEKSKCIEPANEDKK